MKWKEKSEQPEYWKDIIISMGDERYCGYLDKDNKEFYDYNQGNYTPWRYIDKWIYTSDIPIDY